MFYSALSIFLILLNQESCVNFTQSFKIIIVIQINTSFFNPAQLGIQCSFTYPLTLFINSSKLTYNEQYYNRMKKSLLNTKRRHSSHHNLPVNKEFKDFNRPSSSNLLAFAETDLFQGIYQGGRIVEDQTNDNKLLSQKASLNIEKLIKFKSEQINKMMKPTKSSQQLQQQNLFLKGEVNKLRQQNCQLRGKLTLPNEKKGGLQNVGIDFSKDWYWSGNEKNIRVIGMKLQYENVQKQLRQLKEEIKKLKQDQVIKKTKELEIYIKQLQKQNNKLVYQVEYLKKYKQLNENKKVEGEEEIKKLEQAYKKKKQDENKHKIFISQKKKNAQQQILKGEINKKQSTIIFLQQLLRKKDNSQHRAHRQLRVCKRQKLEAIKKYEEMKEQVRFCHSKMEVQKIKFYSYFQSQINKMKREHDILMEEKISEIKSLEELINTRKSSKTNLYHQNINQFQVQNFNIRNSIYQSIKLSNGQSRKLSVDDKNLFNFIQEESAQIESARSKMYATFQQQDNSTIQLNQNSTVGNKKKREPLLANEKHSQNAKKVRKVQFNDIKDLGQLIRLRLIGKRVESSQLKQYFIRVKIFSDQSEKSDDINNSLFEAIDKISKKKQTTDWDEQYISMKEIIQVLTMSPFYLTFKQAFLLSRYLVEDCQIDYVYCDEVNENTREIVGCIFKSLIGEYDIIKSQELVNLHIKIEKYIPNLKKALLDLYPNQTVPKNKLFEVISKTGIQIDERQKQIVTAILALNSESLNSLEYSGIFQI